MIRGPAAYTLYYYIRILLYPPRRGKESALTAHLPEFEVIPIDALDTAEINNRLPEPFRSLEIETALEVPSTNTLLKARAQTGATRDCALVACAQTAGRGRMGRSFHSPAGTGVYVSALLHPRVGAAEAALLTAAAGVAAARAVEELCGKKVSIKWINDIFVDGKKVAGILAEAATAGADPAAPAYVVIGAGFNVCDPEGGFPPELAGVAGSLFGAAKAPPLARETLAGAFLAELWALYAALPDRAFLAEYRRRCFVLGKRVDVVCADAVYPALALGVDDDARLIVRADDGAIRHLNAGEVRVRPR